MEDSRRTGKIISQAAQWTFEGDCSLLSWMQELSQNLEQRASATNDALQQLAVKVNRTAIALDNAANSLTALQYTQFIESRCHDDDETLASIPDTPAEELNSATEQSKTTSEVLRTFLRRNLQMLNNSHEKYSLDFEDSDEDESPSTNNYIYQPKNPYNDALLPHIYGSKLWKEHWHVGLCDGSNEYSGDEASDAFSESSRSSAADNESYESNTANLSEWASSTSIPIEHKHPAQMVAQNVPTIPTATNAPAHNKRISITQRFPSRDDSDTCSTTSRSTTTNPPTRQIGENDLFATLRHDTPVTSTSASSSPQQQQYVASTLRNQRNVPQAPVSIASMLPPFFDATPPVDIFDEAASTKQDSNRTSDVIPQRSAAFQGKVKPVNLFDDDDFNSFMTDVVEKQEIKADQPAQMPVPAIRNLPTKNEGNVTAKQATAATGVDLFVDSLNIERPLDSQPTLQMNINKQTEVKQRKTVNLFDSPENSPPNDSLFPSANINENKVSISQKATKTNITPKSLFDDDEDDDFLNVFGSKKLSLPQRSAGKTLLFDDDSGELTHSTKQTSRLTSGLFGDTPPADNKSQTKALPKVALFANIENKIEENPQITSAKVEVKSKLLEPKAVKPNKNVFEDNLFGDEDPNDLDDLFKKQPKIQQTEAVSNKPLEKVTNTADSSLFENEFEDDGLFRTRSAKEDFRVSNDIASSNVTVKIVEPSKINAASNNKQITAVPTQNADKSTSLFVDEFDDESDDLFSVKSNTKSVKVNQNPKGVPTSSEQETENQSPAYPATAAENSKSVKAGYLKRSLFEDVIVDDESDLFESEKDIAKDIDTNEAQSESQKAAEESDNTIFEVRRATEPTKELQSNAAVSENASNAAVSENASNAAVTVTQISKDELLSTKMEHESEGKAAGFQKSKVNRSSSIESPTKYEEINSVSELMRNHVGFEFDSALPEKTITSETSSESAQQLPNATADAETQPSLSTRADTHNLEYPSIFLDEPPDDDDFFTTLSSNTQPLSVSKLTLDFESDFYEPVLPATPSSAKAATSTASMQSQKDVNKKQESRGNDYSGLRLFSEIPPEDDGEDFGFVAISKSSVENAVPNQRLHSVFYDDFSETLEAVQQIKEKQTQIPALLDDEPPLDRDHFDIVKTLDQLEPTEVIDEVKSFMDSTKPISTVTNDNFKREKENNETQLSKIPPVSSKDVTDEAIQRQDADLSPASDKIRNPAGKLQMPNIKINVQALLPGGSGRPNFKKSLNTTEVNETLDTTTLIPEPRTEARKENFPKAYTPLLTTPSESASSENILPSVCKTRVRAPAGRRPSTRRARQEKYRQSLLAEQAEDDNDEDLPQKNAPSSSLQPQPKEQTIARSTPTLHSHSKTGPSTTFSAFQQSGSIVNAPYANLFDDDDENDFLFRSADSSRPSGNTPTQNADNNESNQFNQRTSENFAAQTRPVPVSVEKRPTYTKYFTENSDDEADDLFKGDSHAAPMGTASQIIPANNDRRTTTKPSNVTAVTKTFFATPPSEDSDEDLFKSSKSEGKTKTTTKVQKTKPLKATTASTVTSVSSQQKATTAIVAGGKLDSIFGSDDEDDNFLSNLNTKNKRTTTKATSAIKPATQNAGGLFSDIESDEDDLFGGGKTKAKQDTIKSRKLTTATKTLLVVGNSTQKPAKVPAAAENSASLTDNPLADLLNP